MPRMRCAREQAAHPKNTRFNPARCRGMHGARLAALFSIDAFAGGLLVQSLLVEGSAPLGDNNRRHAIADKIRQGPRFGHKSVDAQY